MEKIGIFFGSTTGTTETVAEMIGGKLDVAASDIHNVADTDPSKVSDYDCLLLGSSTWGDGELQDDWYGFLDGLKAKDLSGKKVALFGCGDAYGYTDTFCEAMAIIRDGLSGTGCNFIGEYPSVAFARKDEAIYHGGKYIGLPVDNDNESAWTEKRVNDWTDILREELS